MNDTAAPTAFKGRFDRSTKGVTLPPVTVTIERGRVQFFAKVLGERDPIHFDIRAAQDAGYPDLIAPPSFFTVVDAMAAEELMRLDLMPVAALIGCDERVLLHGDESYEYVAPMFAGDEVSLTTTVLDFEDKKGGALELAKLGSEIAHRERGVLVRATRTLIHRLG